jgi:flagellin
METSFLSSDARVGIRTLQNFSALLRTTSERLATGLKINYASDGPTAFFTARSLNNRARDLSRMIDGIGTKLGTIQRQPIPGCGRSKVSRAWRSRSSTRAAVLFRKQPERAAKGAEFDALRTQIDQLAEDSSFPGVNMLGGDTPAVQFNDDGSSSLTLPGTASDASGLGIAPRPTGSRQTRTSLQREPTVAVLSIPSGAHPGAHRRVFLQVLL